MRIARRLLLSTLTVLLACHDARKPAAATQPPARRVDKPAVHGMVLMGTQAFHLSHLPMFHMPHDYQVLLTVRLPDQARAKLAAARAQARGTLLYTIAPRPFVLADVLEPGFSFHADLVRGHFERGGETIVTDVPIEVARVVDFRQFRPGDGHLAELEYVLFGRPDEAFLVHRIVAPPDFDQVLTVVAPAGIPADALARGLIVTFPGKPPGEPLLAGQRQHAQLDGKPVDLDVGAQIYLEEGELAE